MAAPQRSIHPAVIFIDDSGIVNGQGQAWVSLEDVRKDMNLFRVPNIILIGQQHDRVPANQQGLFKVLARTQTGRVLFYAHGKRRLEARQQVKGPIGRTVIADHQFVRQLNLPAETLQLGL